MALKDFPLRRYSDRSLPDYRHIPGYSPHPVRDQAGHSYCPEENAAEHINLKKCIGFLDQQTWKTCGPYLYGVDLFNHRFFWEAHENWEPLWHLAGHKEAGGYFIKGLIQIAAAHLLHRSKRPTAIERMVDRAEKNFDKTISLFNQEILCGIDISSWVKETRRVLARPIEERTQVALIRLAF